MFLEFKIYETKHGMYANPIPQNCMKRNCYLIEEILYSLLETPYFQMKF